MARDQSRILKRGVCPICRNANQVCHTVFVPWVKVQILLQWDQSRVFEVRDLQKYSRIEINTVNEIFRESCCKVISHSPKLLDIVPLCPCALDYPWKWGLTTHHQYVVAYGSPTARALSLWHELASSPPYAWSDARAARTISRPFKTDIHSIMSVAL